MNKPIALFDLDGTLCDYSGKLVKDLNTIRSPHEPEITVEELDPKKETEYIRARRRMITMSQEWWESLEPYNPGMCILTMAKLVGFEIVILSQGPFDKPSAWTGKINWCKKHIPDVESWTLTRNKSLVYGKVLVDDCPDYVMPWLVNRPRGLVIMPEHSWNKNHQHPNIVKARCSSNTLDNANEIFVRLQKAYDEKMQRKQ